MKLVSFNKIHYLMSENGFNRQNGSETVCIKHCFLLHCAAVLSSDERSEEKSKVMGEW